MNSTGDLFERASRDVFHARVSQAPEGGHPNSFVLTDLPVPARDVELLTGSTERIISSINELAPEAVRGMKFFVSFLHDEDAIAEIRLLVALGGYFLPELDSSKSQIMFRDKKIHGALVQTWKRELEFSHLDLAIHGQLLALVSATEHLVEPIVEIGVYQGGSAASILHYLAIEGSSRSLFLADTFSGFSYQAAQTSPDIGWANTHQLEGLADYVAAALASIPYPVKIISGDIMEPETIEKLPQDASMVIVDVDLYDATLAALTYAGNVCVAGGFIVCEDSPSTPMCLGARLAVGDFLASSLGEQFSKLSLPTHDLLIRKTLPL